MAIPTSTREQVEAMKEQPMAPEGETFYARVELYVPIGELEFGALDDLVRARRWPQHIEYPFRLEGNTYEAVVAIAKEKK